MKARTFVVVLAMLTGCSASSYRASTAHDERRRQVAQRDVVLPTATPFDEDPARRAVYLEWYWFGYKEGLEGTASSFCGNGHPMYEVQCKGHGDGNSAGIKKNFPPTASP